MGTNNTKLNEALKKYGLKMRHTRTAKSQDDLTEIIDSNTKVRKKISRLAGYRVKNPGLLALVEEE